MTIHFNGPTSFSLSYIGGITQGAGVGIYEVAGRANDLDGTDEVGYRASKGQAAGVYGAGFTAKSLAGKGARGGMRRTGNKVSSD